MRTLLPVREYALGETLNSGQAFRWRELNGGWEGVVGRRWVRLSCESGGIRAETTEPVEDWRWLIEYLQTETDLQQVIATFPKDESMRKAVSECPGLRLLKQEPWECLASFILSSTKQIVQIRQIIGLLCERFGEPLPCPAGRVYAFPSAKILAGLSESDLRSCKMGFRAPYLRATAQIVSRGEIDLSKIGAMDVQSARNELMRLSGVGRKIADCVLLFAYHFQEAFPLDVWILKALRQLYFPRRRPSPKRLLDFTQTYFGPNAGYAQQYLFHYMRTRLGRTKNEKR
jgi:N-glycosylase/DNA lyase